MREKADEGYINLKNYPNGMSTLVRGFKIDSEELDGGRCVKGSNGKLCFTEMKTGKVLEDYMEK